MKYHDDPVTNAARALADLTKNFHNAQQACHQAIERRNAAQGTEAYHDAAAEATAAYSWFVDTAKELASFADSACWRAQASHARDKGVA